MILRNNNISRVKGISILFVNIKMNQVCMCYSITHLEMQEHGTHIGANHPGMLRVETSSSRLYLPLDVINPPQIP